MIAAEAIIISNYNNDNNFLVYIPTAVSVM